MRVFAFFFLATILASCTSAPDPDDAFPRAKLAAVGPMSSLSSPQLAGDRLVAADGATLPLRRWLPEGRPRAVVLALHGFNDYSNAFAGAGAGWAKNGIATYAYDQRGFGAAPGRGGAPRPDVDGVILVAPAVWGRQTMNVLERVGLWLANLMPAVQFSPALLPVHIQPSDNLPMLRAFNADPLV